jgi:hypothetical protein
VGEGWGCAEVVTEGSVGWQCWQAAQADGSSGDRIVQAWRVAWLDDVSKAQGGPDRFCAQARDGAFRSWLRPIQGEATGRELVNFGSDVEQAFAGAGFMCFRSTASELWCMGDNAFGQIGTEAGPDGDAATLARHVLHVWPANSVSLGTWHACAHAAPRGLGEPGFISCWGRGDYRQLGVPVMGHCGVDPARVLCAREPQRGPDVPGGELPVLYAGDLFTCVYNGQLTCWGANRDGFFGTSGACPSELREAWPTLHGTLPAPGAACSPDQVSVPGSQGLDELDVGPRGLCMRGGGALRCLGAIPTPRGGGVYGAAVSRGANAAACGLRDGGVVCWGEGYSDPGALAVPARIVLDLPPPSGEIAVLFRRAGRVGAGCLAGRSCALAPSPLSECASDEDAPSLWSDLWRSAAALKGRIVHVRGALGVGGIMSTMVGCHGGACCNHLGGDVLLGSPRDTVGPALGLRGLFCAGDESGLCCNAPAYGETVVATGRLVEDDESPLRGGWHLEDVALCRAGGRAE